MAKIVIIAGYAKSLINFRGDLIKEFIKQGHEVFALAPEKDFHAELNSIGAKYQPFSLQRTGINPVRDLYTVHSLVKILKDIKPDIVLSYTIKPVIYGSMAARISGVKSVYSMITGLGYAFAGRTIKQRFLGLIAKLLYKCALMNNSKIYFQNPDDLNLFKRINLVPPNSEVLINGSGVDTEKYHYKKANTQSLSFLLIARLIWDKGIGEFVEAARLLKMKYPTVNFKILGAFDSSPAAIKRDCMENWESEKVIEYLGETSDVRPYIEAASVFVLPSYYPEGTPRSILEAMSMGRPIITADSPGCRETVIDGFNGFLVPAKDSQALANAMERFIANADLILAMGEKSREIAVEKYDVHKVNRSIIQAMDLVK